MLASSQERLEEAVAVKATTMAARNKDKFQVQAEIRQMATEAASCRDLILRKELRKKLGKPGDDKDETSQVQAERIREQRCRGDSLVSCQGRRVHITVNRVLRVRVKMMKDNAKGAGDCFARTSNGVCVRHHALVREKIQRRVQSSSGVDNSTFGVSQEPRRQAAERMNRSWWKGGICTTGPSEAGQL